MPVKEKSVLGVIGEVARLKTMTAVSLRKRYDELCPGQEPRSNNHAYLLKKIAAKLQERPGLAKEGDAAKVATPGNRDPRLPQVGAVICKVYKGQKVYVHVRDDGFDFNGTHFRSLSAIARKVTGTPWNGFGFFGLLAKEGA